MRKRGVPADGGDKSTFSKGEGPLRNESKAVNFRCLFSAARHTQEAALMPGNRAEGRAEGLTPRGSGKINTMNVSGPEPQELQ